MTERHQANLEIVAANEGFVMDLPEGIINKFQLSRSMLAQASRLAREAYAEATSFLETTQVDKSAEPFDHISRSVEIWYGELMHLEDAVRRLGKYSDLSGFTPLKPSDFAVRDFVQLQLEQETGQQG